MIFLTDPSLRYRDSFIEGVREFQREGNQLYYSLPRMVDDFEAFVQRLLAERDKIRVRPGRVPSSSFWLIDDKDYIGTLSVRHELNDFLFRIAGHIGYQIRPTRRMHGYGKESLRLGLLKASELGLSRVLITCDEDNIGSKKIIEHNGGVFENAVEVEGSSVKKLRYWIDLA